MDYKVNYDDKRFAEVEADKKVALSENEKMYGGMINESDKYYQAQIDASEEWADKQTQLQQEQTDFTIKKIKQQKDQAKKEYTKEQSGAYVDWQKEKNNYGVNAEQMAASGLEHTGYSESSQVNMFNTYQNRVATAKEGYRLAVLNYDNLITEARIQNNSVLAEIAYQALQQQLELSLQGFQYKNSLLIEQANQKTNIENTYYGRRQDVLDQINTENALAEEVRQYNASLAEERRQFNASLAEERRQFNASLEAEEAKSATINKSSKSAAVNKSSNSDNSVTVDMDSVLDLGYGPISAKKLDELISAGEVIEYEENGKLKYKKVNKPSLKYR